MCQLLRLPTAQRRDQRTAELGVCGDGVGFRRPVMALDYHPALPTKPYRALSTHSKEQRLSSHERLERLGRVKTMAPNGTMMRQVT